MLFAACNSNSSIPQKTKINAKESLIKNTNSFGLTLFRNINNSVKDESWMISPLSISMAFSMAYNGADGDTKEEMAKALQIESLSLDELNTANLELIKILTAKDSSITFSMANSIWFRNTFNIQPDFIKRNENFYDAKVSEADFSNPQTISEINNWVNNKTNNKIAKITNSISPDEVMFLTNTIYFNGAWTKAFNKQKTITENFTTSRNENITAPMMTRLDSALYFKNETFAAIQIPYGNGNFVMNIFLPNEGLNIENITNKLTPRNWATWMTEFEMKPKVDLKLPKFKMEYKLTLNELLKELGMKKAFSSKANFNKISKNQNLYISTALHKTFIEVDEQGTEATAVTSMVFELTSLRINEPHKIPFYCTKPFLFAITEKNNGSIIFMGKIGNPLN